MPGPTRQKIPFERPMAANQAAQCLCAIEGINGTIPYRSSKKLVHSHPLWFIFYDSWISSLRSMYANAFCIEEEPSPQDMWVGSCVSCRQQGDIAGEIQPWSSWLAWVFTVHSSI